MDFPIELLEAGLGYSGINTTRSALSPALSAKDGDKIGSHPLVCRFVKAVYQMRPAFSRYQYTWHIEEVVEYSSEFHPVEHISRKDLTLKLIMLGALVTGQSGQSVYLRDVNGIEEGKASYQYALTEKVKQEYPGKHQIIPMCSFNAKRIFGLYQDFEEEFKVVQYICTTA